MAIRIIKGKWYVDFRFQYQRYRKKSPLNTKGGARAYETFLVQKLIRGESIDRPDLKPQPQVPTFGEFAPRWFETYVKTNNKPSDQAGKESILRTHLLPRFGCTLLAEIANPDVETLKRDLTLRSLQPQTINNVLNVLSKCLRCAVEWGVLDRLPHVKRLPVTIGPPKMLSDEERRRLVHAAQGGPWFDMIVTAVGTGMRLGELCGLEWQDINFEAGVITVARSYVRGAICSPKNHRVRHIPVPKSVLAVLARHRQTSGVVFRLGNGERVLHRRASHAIRSLCKKAGIRAIGWHVLRHTYASQLASRDVSLRAIQLLLGHATVTTTERYAHLTMNDLHYAVSQLEPQCEDTLGRVQATVLSKNPKESRNSRTSTAGLLDRLATI